MKYFWRTRHDIDNLVHLHNKLNILEIISCNHNQNVELGRLYLSTSALFDIMTPFKPAKEKMLTISPITDTNETLYLSSMSSNKVVNRIDLVTFVLSRLHLSEEEATNTSSSSSSSHMVSHVLKYKSTANDNTLSNPVLSIIPPSLIPVAVDFEDEVLQRMY